MVNDRSDSILAALAARNDGVFTTRQARRSGLSHKQIRLRQSTGQWICIYPSVLRHAGTPVTPQLLRRAALCFAGPDAMLARRSAGELWGLDRIKAPRPELLVPYARHPRAPALVVIRASNLLTTDRVLRSGFPVTAIERTLIDLAAVLDGEQLENAIESARRQQLTTLDAVGNRLESLSGPGRTGAGRVRAAIGRLDERAPSESPLEVKVARLIRDAGLPAPVPQHQIETAGSRYRLDFAWPHERVALECDGRAYHQDFDADRARWSALAAAGWRIVFVTWSDATRRPETVVSRLRQTLGSSLTRS